jgi:hypothetical protein
VNYYEYLKLEKKFLHLESNKPVDVEEKKEPTSDEENETERINLMQQGLYSI